MLNQLAAQVAEACSAIGDQSIDNAGFVPIRRLLDQFQANLVVRPLLVEGMVAIRESSSDSEKNTRWTVLIDSESSGLTPENVSRELSRETKGDPLPVRLRNTVAHELVHTLAFRPQEFGIRLSVSPKKTMRQKDFVKYVEDQTERFSPLLLLPSASLASTVKDLGPHFTADDLLRYCQQMGVSRHVLISRLRQLKLGRDDSVATVFHGMAVGLGEWAEKRRPLFRTSPVFLNFERGLTPSFLLRLLKGQDRASLDELIANAVPEVSFRENQLLAFRSGAGTSASPDAHNMDVQVSVETDGVQKGRSFLYIVRGQLVPQPKAQAMRAKS